MRRWGCWTPLLLLLVLVTACAGGGTADAGSAGRESLAPARGPSQRAPEAPRLVVQLGHAGSTVSAVFSPDGRLVLTGGSEQTARIWDAGTGAELRRLGGSEAVVEPTFTAEGELEGSMDAPVAFSPDGRFVLAAVGNQGDVRLWNAATGAELMLFEGRSGEVYSLGFEPDSRSVWTASFDGSLGWWDVATGAELRTIESERSPWAATSSPDGQLLLTGNFDGTASLWDASTGAELRSFEGHQDFVSACALSTDGKRVLTGSTDDTARLWDAATGAELSRLEVGLDVDAVAFSPDGRLVATGDESGARFWDAASGAELHRFRAGRWSTPVSSLVFSPDGRFLLTAGLVAELWDATTGDLLQRFEGGVRHGFNASVEFSPDLRSLLIGDDLGVRWWDTATGSEVRRFTPLHALTSPIRLSPDGRHLGAGTHHLSRLWHTTSGAELRSLDRHEGYVQTLAFSPDGRRVVTGSWDGARLWDVATGSELLRLAGQRVIRDVTFSPDGRLVVTGGDGLRLWDASNGDEVARVDTGDLASVAVSPDGRLIAAGKDPEVRLFDVSTGAEVGRLSGHTGTVRALAFSPDGRLLLTGSADHTARIWRLVDREPLWHLQGHEETVAAVAFSPDGLWALTASLDSTVRLWEVATGEERARIISFRDDGWAVVDPFGRFDTSDLEETRGLHWLRPGEPFTPLPFEVFMRDYYEPGLLARVLRGEDLAPVRSLSELEIRRPAIAIREITAEPASPGGPADRISLTLEVTKPEGSCRTEGGGHVENGAFDLRVFRDRQLVAHHDGEIPIRRPGETARLSFEGIRLPRDGRESVALSAFAFNCDRVKSATVRHSVPIPEDLPRRRGRAYVVTVGVNRFESPAWDLRYAAEDARQIREAVTGALEARPEYAREDVVAIPLISDGGGEPGGAATKQHIRDVLALLAGMPVPAERRASIPAAARIEPARPEDLLLLSFSSHGYRDERGTFYLFPADIGPGLGREVTPELLAGAISSAELTAWLRDVDAGEMVMIVDACHSAASVEGAGYKPGPFGSRGLGQMAYSKGMRVLAASQADEAALESALVSQGLLSFALVREGLAERSADENADGRITVAEWLRYGRERVPTLAEQVRRGEVVRVGPRGAWLVSFDDEEAAPVTRRHLVQQPALFDFGKGRPPFVLWGPIGDRG